MINKKMDIRQSNVFLRMETTCGSLLVELKEIWDEVGECDSGRDTLLLEIEQECLEAYRRKVDQAYQYRAQLRQTIADAEAELAQFCSTLGERPPNVRQVDQKPPNLKEELNLIVPFLEEMRKKRTERRKQFVDVLNQIRDISNEIYKSPVELSLDENDLSLKRLEELHNQLHALQKEKSERLKQVLDNLNELSCLCMVLGMDFKDQIRDIHPTLDENSGSKNISDDTIKMLTAAIQNLKDIKMQRLQRLQDLAGTLLELWNLMDTPSDEQIMFQNVTSKIAASEHEITEPDCLSTGFLSHVEAEVSRLESLKSSKMKELILKKRSELEEICRQTHMVVEAEGVKQFSVEAIDSGAIDPSCMLEQIELQISEAKEEAYSRKDILERVEKWKAACGEECWLEEYNRDESRYNGGRGGHLSLKRAEKARVLVTKLPAIVEVLISRTKSWEEERGKVFLYDGVQVLSMLEDYNILREEKERERQRQRDQRKLQGRLLTEQEVLFGSKPSPTKTSKKLPRYSSVGTASAVNRRVFLGGSALQKQNLKTALQSHPISKLAQNNQNGGNRNNTSTGKPFKRQMKASNPRDLGTLKRKPFSPLSGTVHGTTNFKNTPEKHDFIIPVVLAASRTPTSSPIQLNSSGELEHSSTPRKVASPVPLTPSALSMYSATPYTPASVRVSEVDDVRDLEYSFEEMRAGFVLP